MTATLPYRWYADAEMLALERSRLFAPAWHYGGHAGLVAEPGSYFTCRAGDVPIVVVRDREGALLRDRRPRGCARSTETI